MALIAASKNLLEGNIRLGHPLNNALAVLVKLAYKLSYFR
jgi:hypothetical protein